MLFQKTINRSPLSRWFANIAQVGELRDLLASEAFEQAAATLISAAQPTYADVIGDDDVSRRKQAWLAGYNDAFNDLLKLTKAPTSRSAQAGEWEHIERKK